MLVSFAEDKALALIRAPPQTQQHQRSSLGDPIVTITYPHGVCWERSCVNLEAIDGPSVRQARKVDLGVLRCVDLAQILDAWVCW